MAKRKPGDWWDKSWSVVTGCNWPPGEVPPACEHCWAEKLANRFPAAHRPPFLFTDVITHPDRIGTPARTKKPTVWATSLLGDLFHPDVPDHFIRDVLDGAINRAHAMRHRFAVLTKRWDRAAHFFAPLADQRNVILMGSVWDQESTDAACNAFARLPVGWGLHMEPLLGPVRLADEQVYCSGCVDAGRDEYGDAVVDCHGQHWDLNPRPSWVVVGGETGPGARPMHPQWVRDLRDQCREAEVPFWFKGWGNNCYSSQLTEEGYRLTDANHNMAGMADACWHISKALAGRLLDGEEHNGVPWTAPASKEGDE